MTELPKRLVWVVRPVSQVGLEHVAADADLIKCTVCRHDGIVAYLHAYQQLIDFSTAFGEPELRIPDDVFLCQTCTRYAEQDQWGELVRRRLTHFPGNGDLSIDQRERYVTIEFAFVRRALEGRGFIYVDAPGTDFRLMYRADFGAGSLPVLPASDDREPDAHAYIDRYRDVTLDELEVVKETFRRRYSYAIPGRAALEAIAHNAPNGVVELGAGNGYWAYLLRNYGVDVEAYDAYPVTGSSNPYWKNWPTQDCRTWTAVIHGDESVLARSDASRSLLLVWPPLGDDAGTKMLMAYRGDTVCYVGDWRGATGDVTLHNVLKVFWKLVETVRIPTWYGFNDQLMIFKRRPEDEAHGVLIRGKELHQRNPADVQREVIERMMREWQTA